MSWLNLGIVCYLLVGNVLSSSVISKNTNIGVFRTIILLVVWFWCEIWSLILREGYRQRDFEGRVLWETCWAEEEPGDSGLEETA